MSAAFLAVGNESVNTASVDYAAWVADKDNPQTGKLQVTLAGSKDCLQAKKLGILTDINNELIRFGTISAEKAAKAEEAVAAPPVETKAHGHKNG